MFKKERRCESCIHCILQLRRSEEENDASICHNPGSSYYEEPVRKDLDCCGEWEDHETKCEKEAERNQKFLDIFEKDMIEEGLSKRRRKNHLSNVDCYLNDYAMNYCYYASMEEALDEISGFLTYHIPEKYIGSIKNIVQENATSLRKFYKCMAAHGFVDPKRLKDKKDDISEAVADGGKTYKQFRKEFLEDNK